MFDMYREIYNDDLRMPMHDEILLWLDRGAEKLMGKIAQPIANCRSEIRKADALRFDYLKHLGEPPEIRYEPEVRELLWQKPIVGLDTDKIIGFVDIYAEVRYTHLGYGGNPVDWIIDTSVTKLNFEVRSSILSLGSLLREMNYYCQHTFDYDRYFIVSPDARFIEQLTLAGYGFLKYPEGTIYEPGR